MEGSMKVTGRGICVMAKALNATQMGILTLDNSRRVKLMEKVFIRGPMVKFMMENGYLE